MNKLAFIGGAALAALGLVSLAGCQSPGATVTSADAQSLTTAFCQTWLPAAAPVIGDFNAQIQADYATVKNACAAIGDGQTVNVATVAVAAVELYQGVSANYPKLVALSPRDLATAHELIDARRLAAWLGARP
jgi:hypothetical protein